MRIILGFLLGFSIGYIGLLSTATNNNPPRVLAQYIEVNQTPDSTTIPLSNESSSPEPTSSSEPTTSPIQSLDPTSTPKPTQESTSTPTPTPSPSPQPTITPTATSNPTATPATEPTSTPDVWSPPQLEPWFAQYAGQYGVDKNLLERIANCESHFNTNAVNKDYVGMFQFSTGTWINYRAQMGADPNTALRTNPEEAIKTGAFVVSKRGSAPWPSCL